ncbi:DUF262 domain-containing protein [Campylobacter sp. CNRCH_2013_0898h]|uniref:DUF262 domain-containing protein n=1 Tax=Campylobacter sp. CNRCH_2013_0898h TaxID=2911601 RepID=UPI0021E6CE8C|nr:DUF262 domain-containing protein [Campylobacter sp. CNRCH_2013_0898h]MCV3552895.1 DUF262 domain-containing protein [Campylobacter sp. CNRCH_2013_0898h]
MQQAVMPDKQSVENCLKQKKYYIDFYQRNYIWSKETTLILLNDIFYNFNLGYQDWKDSEITEELMEKYNWYYLNVYITNNINSKIYIVDGQQRLTTLTLIATKLYHMLDSKEKLRELLGQCIFSNNGFNDFFNIDNDKRYKIMDIIFNKKNYPDEFDNETEKNLIERYNDISNYLENEFKENNYKKLKVFILYFLKRLVLVELAIDQNDTPMIFEVINDRGEPLKPFEILKGKLIGVLDKNDTEYFCKIWDSVLSTLSKFEDSFFIDFLKSRFIFKRNSDVEKNINKRYHRYIFENNEIANNLNFRKQDFDRIENIKKFIKNEINYYGKLYKKITNSNNDFLRYCKVINDLSGQYQNILAACEINDKLEDEKINLIAKEYDRLWMLLNLNGMYNSNNFQDITYSLNEKLKEVKLEEYKTIFDCLLKDIIKNKKKLESDPKSLLDYKDFLNRDYTNVNPRFLRYLFARVEKFICDNMNIQPQNDVFTISTKTGDKTGYHIEHILSNNATNINYFDNEEEFQRQRNLLGGLLLLKDKSNISSGNEEYGDKLKTYIAAKLIWGCSICEDFHHRTNKDFKNFNDKYFSSENGFKFYKEFDKNALFERTKLLYEIVKIIWEVDR